MFIRARLLLLFPAVAAALLACTKPSPRTLTRSMPTEVGECVESTIATVGGRLEGDRDFRSGTSVSFANGGYQVSHGQVEPLMEARVGDPVRICLVRVPEGCPPGDDRGRTYETTNLRTNVGWQLADSSHRCGGA